MDTVTEPDLVPVVGGWFACGTGWCVKGETIEEALANYAAAVRKHAEIAARPDPVLRESQP